MKDQGNEAASSDGDSLKTVLVALAANTLVGLAKTAAAVVTGSSSMVAEAAHSWADVGNQVFLYVAERKAVRPADAQHPLGYGRSAYVWSMIAAFGLFIAGAVVSIWHGVQSIVAPGEAGHESYGWAYLVLGIAFVLEGISFIQAWRSTRGAALKFNMHPLRYLTATSRPTLRAVVLEDAAALIGVVLAAAGMALHQWTGNPIYDALGSIAVGILLAFVAFFLISRNHDFLVGEALDGPARDEVLAALNALPDVERVSYLHLEFVGPGKLFLVAAVDLRADRRESELAQTLRALEQRIEAHPRVQRAVLTIASPAAPVASVAST